MKDFDILTFDEIIAGNKGTIDTLIGNSYKRLAQKITCVDGTTLSVQASQFHYCTPRTDHGPYIEVEVGFPSAPPPETWGQYYDGSREEFVSNPSGSVYGRIPVGLVREYIDAHGGEAS